MKITESICTGNRRYKAAEKFSPVGVVLHSIGTPQPDAKVLRDYWQRDASAYVVHYMVDDANILRTMPDNFKCWHVGSPGNGKYIGIEMGEPSQIRYTSGATFTVSDLDAAQDYATACYNNAVWLIAKLCKDHGWNPDTAIYTHGEITKQKLSNTDHVDPEHLWNGLGLGITLRQLRSDVRAAMVGTVPDFPSTATEMYRVRKTWADAVSQIGAYRNFDNAKAACKTGYAVFDSAGNQVYPETGFQPYIVRVTAKSGLNVRTGPGSSYSVAMAVPCGGAYTIVEEKNGWGRLKSGAGWVYLKYTNRIS